ncbi:hypothetical protein PspLS_05832, partial [Pyricularia sp. CBS 133598]
MAMANQLALIHVEGRAPGEKGTSRKLPQGSGEKIQQMGRWRSSNAERLPPSLSDSRVFEITPCAFYLYNLQVSNLIPSLNRSSSLCLLYPFFFNGHTSLQMVGRSACAGHARGTPTINRQPGGLVWGTLHPPVTSSQPPTHRAHNLLRYCDFAARQPLMETKGTRR